LRQYTEFLINVGQHTVELTQLRWQTLRGAARVKLCEHRAMTTIAPTTLTPKSLNPEPGGQPDASLHAFVYQRLHALAHGQLKGGVRFAQTTSLVHEAYLRIAPKGAELGRSHFFAVAATAMRNILIDRSRAANALKRGSGLQCVALDAFAVNITPHSNSVMEPDYVSRDDPAALLRVDKALERVRRIDARLATLVELKVFGGLDVPELADALEISERSVKRYWRQARALLLADFA
jgi:RNA polymerase sigma factor (TIGR02999 family)